jgi:hypothetical protein
MSLDVDGHCTPVTAFGPPSTGTRGLGLIVSTSTVQILAS